MVKCVISITIAFALKDRRKVFFGEKREAIREIILRLCQPKGVESIEGEVCPDDVHMLEIPPKDAVSGFMEPSRDTAV